MMFSSDPAQTSHENVLFIIGKQAVGVSSAPSGLGQQSSTTAMPVTNPVVIRQQMAETRAKAEGDVALEDLQKKMKTVYRTLDAQGLRNLAFQAQELANKLGGHSGLEGMADRLNSQADTVTQTQENTLFMLERTNLNNPRDVRQARQFGQETISTSIYDNTTGKTIHKKAVGTLSSRPAPTAPENEVQTAPTQAKLPKKLATFLNDILATNERLNGNFGIGEKQFFVDSRNELLPLLGSVSKILRMQMRIEYKTNIISENDVYVAPYLTRRATQYTGSIEIYQKPIIINL